MDGETLALVIAGGILGGGIVIVFLLMFLRAYLRGPTAGSDNRKRLDGRTVVITGANTGIGKEVAKDLSNRGARVVILCRDVAKGGEAAREIRSRSGNDVMVLELDLADLASVRACAQKMHAMTDRIDILINNAGVMHCPNWKTKDGFDMQFGTNHLGHFLLDELLLPLVRKSVASGFHPRIIITSSLAHELGRMNWDDLQWDKKYEAGVAYSQSKLANVLHAKEMARRLEGSGISVYSLHPGVVATELWRHLDSNCCYSFFAPLIKPLVKTPFHGAQTTLYCALEDSIEQKSGLYYSDCREKRPSPNALNVADQKKLWEIIVLLIYRGSTDDEFTALGLV